MAWTNRNQKDDFADTLKTVNGVWKREREREVGPKGGKSEGG